jgi:ATP-binding cassette subfamily C protein CydCD
MRFDARLLRLARQTGLYFVITVGLGFAGGVLIVWQARTLSLMISQVFLDGLGLGQVKAALQLLLELFLLRAASAWGMEAAASAAAQHVKTSLRRQLFAHLLDLGPGFTHGERTGELVNTATEGIEALDAYFSQYLPQLALAALVPLTLLAFIFPLDWLSGLVLLLTAPLIPLFMVLIGSLAEALTRRQWQSLSRMSAYFLDVLQGLTTLKIFGRSRAQAKVIAQVSERYRQTTLGVLRVAFLSALALEMIATLSTAVVAVEIGLRLLYGRLAFEQAFFVLLLAPEFYLPLRLLGTRFHAGMAGVAAAERILSILETKRPGRSMVESQGATALPEDLSGLEICFNEVHYTYPDGRSGLNSASFELVPGKVTALVGPSGSGKSTLASLLLRFIEPDQGQIEVNSAPLSAIPAGEWRRRVAWVPQEPYLFAGSVAENIRLARPEASQAEIEAAAKFAYAHDFIRGLPQGYDTSLGERGARLSGGQAQRIALARAFLKDAPLLILDEPTSNLDPENEALIEQATTRLLAGRTTLVIAHRLNTVARASRIIVLENGRVAEQGAPTELQARPGTYQRLLAAGPGRNDLAAQAPCPSHPAPMTIPAASPAATGDLPGALPAILPADIPASQSSWLAPLKRLLQMAAPYTGWIALSVLLGFATLAAGIGLMSASAYIIAQAALHPSIAELQVAIVGVRFFGIARGVFRYLERYTSHQVTFRLLARLRVWFYQALEPLAPARLMRHASGDLLSRAVGDIGMLENFYVRALAPPLAAVLVALAAGAWLASFNPSLASAWLACYLAAGMGVPVLSLWLGRLPGRRLSAERAALNQALVDGIQGAADLLAFGRQAAQAETVDRLSCQAARTQAQMARLGALQSALSGLLANLGMAAVLAVGIPLVASGQLRGALLPVLALAALTSFEAVLPLPLAAQYLESCLQSARRLFELVEAQPEVRDPQAPDPLPAANDLSVRGLSFQYASTEDATLVGLSFDLPEGKRLAVVGPSGAGKTTLLNLLLRLWDYRQGEIRLGGRDLHCFSAEDLRARMAVVSQTTHLFNASLRENLLIARPQASQAELVRAAEMAHLHGFIQSLPQGYETWIGEQGLLLSGGERQRLAIARALLRDAPLLLLDEPTAHLDALTERQVLESLRLLMAGRSVLLITHRLVGLDMMDEILVLDRGRIVERGTQAALLSQGGLYRHMWDLQNQVINEW